MRNPRQIVAKNLKRLKGKRSYSSLSNHIYSKTGISIHNITLWRMGKEEVMPDIETLFVIAEALDADVREFFVP